MRFESEVKNPVRELLRKSIRHWLQSEDAIIFLQNNLSDSWISPSQSIEALKRAIGERFSGMDWSDKIQLLGEHENRTVYCHLPYDGVIYIFTPFSNIKDCILLQEMMEEGYKGTIRMISPYSCYVTSNSCLQERLKVPKILLINMTSPHFEHTPSVALGVGMVGAILRKKQKADVHILDMKLGVTNEEILKFIERENPQMVGASIDFGEKNTFCHLFHRINSCPKISSTLLFAGNYLAYIHAQELLNRFPELIINHGEGEQFILDLVDYYQGKINKNQISAALYIDSKTGEIQRTPLKEIHMGELASPAVDTVLKVAHLNGVFPMELSRGCNYNGCSFCPRHHKIKKWKSLSPDMAVQWIERMWQFFVKYPSVRRKIYFVDEEFIGKDRSGAGDQWFCQLGEKLVARKLPLVFEFNTSVEQIYNPKKDEDWHIQRWQALVVWKQAGLQRILLGVESGSNSVLKRFNKQHRVEDSICALRILSALGIDIRITFISYDPLMDLNEFYENFVFLGRRDAFFREFFINEKKLRNLYCRVNQLAFIQENSIYKQLFHKVCYLHNTLKVLSDSRYMKMMQDIPGKYFNRNNTNKSFGPAISSNQLEDFNPEEMVYQYLDPVAGVLSKISEQWMSKANVATHLLGLPFRNDTHERRRKRVHLIVKIHDFSYLYFEIFLWLYTIDKINFKHMETHVLDWGWESVRMGEVVIEFIKSLKLKVSDLKWEVGQLDGEILKLGEYCLRQILREFYFSHGGWYPRQNLGLTTGIQEGVKEEDSSFIEENLELFHRFEIFSKGAANWEVIQPFS